MSENNKDVLLPLPPEEDDGMLIGSVVNGDLYMLRAAHTVLFSSPPCRRPTVSLENVIRQPFLHWQGRFLKHLPTQILMPAKFIVYRRNLTVRSSSPLSPFLLKKRSFDLVH